MLEDNLFFTPKPKPVPVPASSQLQEIEALKKELERWQNLYKVLKDDYDDFCKKHHEFREKVKLEFEKLKSQVPKEPPPGSEWSWIEVEDGVEVYKPCSLSSSEYTMIHRISKSNKGIWSPGRKAFLFANKEDAQKFAREAGKLIPNK